MTVATALEVSWKPLTNSKPKATTRLTIRMRRPAVERSERVDATSRRVALARAYANGGRDLQQ